MISLAVYEKMEAERPPEVRASEGLTDTGIGGIGVAERTCQRGHDLAVEGYFRNGCLNCCRACKRDRRKRQERSARLNPCQCGCGELVSGRLKRGHWSRLPSSAVRASARDGDKLQARGRVKVLIRAGKLPSPSSLPCSDCGKSRQPGGSNYEYDHYLGYAAEHHEHVQAVCISCHRKRDAARRRRT